MNWKLYQAWAERRGKTAEALVARAMCVWDKQTCDDPDTNDSCPVVGMLLEACALFRRDARSAKKRPVERDLITQSGPMVASKRYLKRLKRFHERSAKVRLRITARKERRDG